MPEIAEAGERTLTFFHGVFSHAVLHHPAIGEWRANSRYGFGPERIEPDEATIDVAARAIASLLISPAYARVDGLVRPGQDFLVTEVELLEPTLFLYHYPERAATTASMLQQCLPSAAFCGATAHI